MSEDKDTVERSYAIRKDLNKKLDYIKIETERGKAELVNEAIEAYVTSSEVPVVGSVSAGGGVPAKENIEEYLRLPDWLGNGAEYLLRVRGVSMLPTLSAGDIVGVSTHKPHGPKDLVVALSAVGKGEDDSAFAERESVVKRYENRGTVPYLVSDNPDYPEQPEQNYQIIGRVVCVLRVL